MTLVPSFVDLLQPLSVLMTTPSFESFQTLLAGWVFTRRCTMTGLIVAASAAVGHKHHSAYHRFFAAARWNLSMHLHGSGSRKVLKALIHLVKQAA